MVENDEQCKNLTVEDQGRIKNILVKHREIDRRGARPSNRAAAQDARWTIDQVSKEVRTVCHLTYLCSRILSLA